MRPRPSSAETAQPVPSPPGAASNPDSRGPQANRERLDELVINVELTLVSIIQGVALSFLADSTRQLIAGNAVEYYLYALNGLLIIFLFWSRAVIHTVTVIRWPLEFGHNFLYIACALFEAISFANLNQPLLWNALQTLFAVLVWLLFAVDLRLVRARQLEFAGSAVERLFHAIRQDQMLNIIAAVPVFIVFYLVVTGVLWHQQVSGGRFHWHLYFAGAQTVGLTGYLFYLVRFFSRISPWLVMRH